MNDTVAVRPLDVQAYRRHSLHAPERIWVEKNCYIDIWIELIHALGHEPLAMLPFTLTVDFLSDQWTFFKPPHGELRELYGLDVQEMYVWRPLLEHAEEHLAAGRFISTEADAWWLPDTAGTDYRTQHTKTTIVLNAVNRQAQTLGYFHNAGYHQLEGEDFERLFRVGVDPDSSFMPLFAELVRTDLLLGRDAASLRQVSRRLLRWHVERLPRDNPVRAFQQRFSTELTALSAAGLATYHIWAFGTLRQLGAAAELSALYLAWLAPESASLAAAAESYLLIANTCKALILKAARAVNGKRALDVSATFDELAGAWERATAALRLEQ